MELFDEHGRREPPVGGSEIETLTGFLDWQRSTLEWKTRGLETDGLNATIPTSSMTLGGIVKHMAWVEDHWFSYRLHARPRSPMWLTAEATSHPDWEWVSSVSDSQGELRQMWAEAVERSRVAVAEALARGGLDQSAMRVNDDGSSPSLRWIMVHMIEEYARHNGHADILRESVDGEVGE